LEQAYLTIISPKSTTFYAVKSFTKVSDTTGWLLKAFVDPQKLNTLIATTILLYNCTAFLQLPFLAALTITKTPVNSREKHHKKCKASRIFW
jgi:hypothetical protein